MNTTDFNNPDDRLDRAVAVRLAKLRAMPVDTSRLEARLRQQIPLPSNAATHRRFFLFRPLRAAAAGFILVGIVLAAVISSSSGPALASADRLAEVHQEMVSGRSHAMKVSSIEAAAAALRGEWPKAPALPDMPDDHVMACCVHEVGRKKMACVALEIDGIPVTMAVADRADVKSPQGATVVHGGITYRVQSAGGVNMAMTERGGRWICLMGRLPVDRLIELISQSRF